MKSSLLCALVAATFGTPLATHYEKERAFRVEHAAHFTLQTTEIEIEVDGEPQEIPDGARPKSETTYQWTFTDRVREAEGSTATKVRRHFETIEGKSVRTMNGEDRTEEMPSPFDGLTLDLARDGDDVTIEVVDGKKPDHDGALTGHRLELPLDALLPQEAVDEGATWELDDDAVRRALGFALHAAYFPRPSAEEAPSEGGEGRGRRGRTGQMSRLSSRGVLSQMEWSGTAEVASMKEEVDGVECVKIDLELHAQGELPETTPDGGGGRGGRAFGATSAIARALENSYDAELEGALYFSIESKRPVRLDLEGKMTLENNRETTRGERTMRMRTKSEGTLEVRIGVSEVKPDAK